MVATRRPREPESRMRRRHHLALSPRRIMDLADARTRRAATGEIFLRNQYDCYPSPSFNLTCLKSTPPARWNPLKRIFHLVRFFQYDSVDGGGREASKRLTRNAVTPELRNKSNVRMHRASRCDSFFGAPPSN